MKKLAISVLLLLLCGDTMGSDWRTFGSKPEENKFLSVLEDCVRKYYNTEDPDELGDDLVTHIADVILLHSENGPIHSSLSIPPEIVDGFLEELLDDLDDLEDSCFELEPDKQAVEALINGWSAHELLKDWRQRQEANGSVKKSKFRRLSAFYWP